MGGGFIPCTKTPVQVSSKKIDPPPPKKKKKMGAENANFYFDRQVSFTVVLMDHIGGKNNKKNTYYGTYV